MFFEIFKSKKKFWKTLSLEKFWNKSRQITRKNKKLDIKLKILGFKMFCFFNFIFFKWIIVITIGLLTWADLAKSSAVKILAFNIVHTGVKVKVQLNMHTGGTIDCLHQIPNLHFARQHILSQDRLSSLPLFSSFNFIVFLIFFGEVKFIAFTTKYSRTLPHRLSPSKGKLTSWY